jgi:hypothetical protein
MPIILTIPPPPPAPPDTPYLWWDLQDLSTVWQDTSGTISATTNNDLIARIDNKGSHVMSVELRSNSSPTNDMTFRDDLTGGGGFWFAKGDGSQDFLEGTLSGATTQIEYTFMAVHIHQDFTAGSGPFIWDHTQELDALITSGAIWQNFGNGNAHATTIMVADTLYACRRDGTEADTHARFNWQSGGEITGTANSFLPDEGGTFWFGARSSAPTSPLRGAIAELLIYDSVLSAGNMLLLESYITDKYGIAWAA